MNIICAFEWEQEEINIHSCEYDDKNCLSSSFLCSIEMIKLMAWNENDPLTERKWLFPSPSLPLTLSLSFTHSFTLYLSFSTGTIITYEEICPKR